MTDKQLQQEFSEIIYDLSIEHEKYNKIRNNIIYYFAFGWVYSLFKKRNKSSTIKL